MVMSNRPGQRGRPEGGQLPIREPGSIPEAAVRKKGGEKETSAKGRSRLRMGIKVDY